jgi:hypothetical protein
MDDETRELCGLPKIWHDKMKRVLNPDTGIFERVKSPHTKTLGEGAGDAADGKPFRANGCGIVQFGLT